jgi:hypothetical protein
VPLTGRLAPPSRGVVLIRGAERRLVQRHLSMYAPGCRRGDNPPDGGEPLPARWPALRAGHHEPVTDKVPHLAGLHVRGRVKVVPTMKIVGS